MTNNPNRWIFGCGILAAICLVPLIVGGIYSLSVCNTQASLKNAYEAKIKANEADLSNLKSKIPEAAQVTDAQMKKLEDLFTGYAEARSPDGGGALAQWVTEAVPNIDQATFLNLQNVIVSGRDDWSARQKELVGITEVYNRNLVTQPRALVLGLFGDYEKIDALVISTAATKEAFRTGQDEPMDLFPTPGGVEQ